MSNVWQSASSTLRSSEIGAVLRFVVVGLAATAIYLGVSLWLLAISVTPQIANLLAFVASTLASYCGHYFFTYRSDRSHLLLGARFVAVTLALTLFCSVLHQAVLLAGANPAPAAVIVALSYPPVSFLFNHFWAFERGRKGNETTAGAAPKPGVTGGVAICVLLALAALIAVSPHRLLYDERYYMQASYFLAGDFDFWALMRTPLDVAAGPLYAYLHVFASPLTQLQPPAIRYVNLASLLIAIWAIAATLRRLNYDGALSRAAMLLAVPMIGPTSGLALTELPPLALVSLATLGVTEAAAVPGTGRSWGLFALAGVLGGLAILGRQTYLPGLVGFVAVGLGQPRVLLPALAGLALALATLAPMLVAWGGISPPWFATALSGVVPQYAVMAFVYLAVAVLLIAPRFAFAAFATPRLRLFSAIAVSASLAAAAAAGFEFAVASRVIDLLPGKLQWLAQLGLNLAMVGIATVMVVAATVALWERRSDRAFLLFGLLALLLNATAAGIGHQFSSRYVLAAFPFALLMLQPWFKPGTGAAARIVLGATLGFASLSAYYWNQPAADPNEKMLAPPELIAKMPLTEPRSDPPYGR